MPRADSPVKNHPPLASTGLPRGLETVLRGRRSAGGGRRPASMAATAAISAIPISWSRLNGAEAVGVKVHDNHRLVTGAEPQW